MLDGGSMYSYAPYFPTDTLLEGPWSVHVETFGTSTESFDVALKSLKPEKVILFEPTLEFMRCLEVYNHERKLHLQAQYGVEEGAAKQVSNPLKVHIIRYSESTEFY